MKITIETPDIGIKPKYIGRYDQSFLNHLNDRRIIRWCESIINNDRVDFRAKNKAYKLMFMKIDIVSDKINSKVNEIRESILDEISIAMQLMEEYDGGN